MAKKIANEKKKASSVQGRDDREHVKQAHDQAEHDIAEDPDLSIHSPNDDLDESELANLGGDKNDLI